MPPQTGSQPQIAPPFGYQDVVPMLKTHRLALPKAGAIPQFLQSANAVPISHAEFPLIARNYPIVFTSADGKNYAAVAVLGIAAGENLFYSGEAWASGAYVPAYSRRYPFCMARVTLNQVEQKDRVICVEKAAIDESAGEAMFDAQGNPLEKWAGIERLLAEYEADLERSREMCATLSDYGLLEPFTMQAKLNPDKGGAAMQLTGMHRVAEKNLENLNAAQLKNLIRKGFLARLYLHLISLDNFSALLERKAGRTSSDKQ